MNRLRDIYLYGRLGRLYGKKHRLAVETPAEALRALSARHKGFWEEFKASGGYRFVRGKKKTGDALEEAPHLNLRFGKQRELHVIPVPQVAGIETLVYIAVAAVVAVVAAVAFMPTIEPPKAEERKDDANSFIFDGVTNSTEQGGPVPLVFGEFLVGTTVVSAGIETTDIPYEALPTDAQGSSTPGWGGSPLGRDLVFGKGGKGGGEARAAVEDPNSLQSQATAKIIEVLSEGEIEGLVDGLKSVYFDGTPVQNADGTFNFKGIALEFREGSPSQSYIPNFTSQENARSLDNREISQLLGPVVQTISDADTNRARVTLGVNSLFYTNPENGDMKSSSVTVRIELQSNGGGYSTIVDHTFSGKCTSRYQKSFDIPLPAGGDPWDIRVSRITADRTTSNYQDDVVWVSLTEIIDAKLSYPDTAIVGLTADAKQFGSKIPTRGYKIKGIKCEVPTNFDPDTRTYATSGPGTSGGVWDGTFVRAWTNEPAWIFRELCLNQRWGLGRKLGVSNVDKWSLYEISLHNSEHVPDGLGGTEPRYTLNVVLNTREQAFKVMTTMAATFRSNVYWSTGQVTLVQDSPRDASRLISIANVEDEIIDYETPDIEDKVSAYVVAWNDPEDDYRLAYEVVEDPTLRQLIGWKTKEVVAYGTTSRGQAVRFGKRLLNDQEYASNAASWKSGFEQADLTPGMVVKTKDPEFTTSRLGGRIVSSTTTSVVLDYEVTLEFGELYTLDLMMRDGTVASRTVTTGPGTTTTLSWATPIANTPIPGAMWALTPSTLDDALWRVTGNVEEDGVKFSIRVQQYDPDHWDRVEQGLVLEPRATAYLPSGALEIPTGLGYREFVKLINGDTGSPSIYFNWQPVSDSRVTAYQVQVKRPNTDDYEAFPDTSSLGVEINNITEGEHSLRVRSVDSIGRKSGWREIVDTFDGLPEAPQGVTAFDAYPGEDGVRFVWQPVVSVSPLTYEIRVGASWEAGQRICRVRDDTITVKLPTSLILDQNFWIKPLIVGTSLYAADAFLATTYQQPLPTRNIVVQNNFRTAGSTWDGRLRQLSVQTLDAQEALRLGSSGGVRYGYGDYRAEVTLTGEFYARNWLETTLRNVNDTSPTWDSLTVTWDSLGDLTWSVPDGPLTDVTLDAYIAVDTAPSDVIEFWPLGSDTTGDIAATAATISVLAASTATALFNDGSSLGDYSLLGWEGNVDYVQNFTHVFDVQPSEAYATEVVFATHTDGTHYIQVGYDPVDDVLFAEDELANRATCAAPAWDTTDVYTIALVVTATERRIMWVSQDDTTGAFGSLTIDSAHTFDTLYIGSGGEGAAETWADAGYTWASTAAGRTWDELSLVLFAAPGTYARMFLRTYEYTSSNYATRLFLLAPNASYSDFRPLIPGDYGYTSCYIWQRLSAPTGVGDTLYLTESVLNVDVPDIIDGGEATLTAATLTINYNRTFHEPPIVVAVHKGGATPALVNIVSIGLTSFVVKLVDPTSPSTLVAGDINWSAKGY